MSIDLSHNHDITLPGAWSVTMAPYTAENDSTATSIQPLVGMELTAPQSEGKTNFLRRKFTQLTSQISTLARKIKAKHIALALTIAGIATVCIYPDPILTAIGKIIGRVIPLTEPITVMCGPTGIVGAPISTATLDEFLNPVSFPRTIDNAKTAVALATAALAKRQDMLLATSDTERTFENTVMAYHDMMVSFDAVERLIRSERVLPDEAVGKQELLDECIKAKDVTFSNSSIQNMFISYTEAHIASKSTLTSVEWQYLKGLIGSIKDNTLSQALLERLNRVKLAMKTLGSASYAYLKGHTVSKVLDADTKALSYLTMNLCFMPATNPMIYGGLLPWRWRIDAIAEKIRSLNPDLLFLQEIYDVHAIFELHKRLSPCYAHFYGNIIPRVFGLSHESQLPSSGLAIISKFQLTDLQFEPYRSVTPEGQPSKFDRLKFFGFDRNYGVFHGLVMNGQKPLAHVATTHENPFYETVRTNQTSQIVELFQRLAKKDTASPIILNGDLNIEKGDLNEGGERLIVKNFREHYDGGPTNLEFGDFWHKWNRNVEKFVAANHTYWTLDRSLLWSGSATSSQYTIETERVTMFDVTKPADALSDHHGVLTHLTFT